MLRARHKLLFQELLGNGSGYLLNQNFLDPAQYLPGGWLLERHSRATTATRVNSSGVIESVAIDVPRLQHDSAGNPLGYLSEAQGTNNFTQSDWSNAILTGIGRTLNAGTSPSGDSDATKLTLTTGAALTSSQQNTSGLTASVPKCLSVFSKPGASPAPYLMVAFCKSGAQWGGLQVVLSDGSVAASGILGFSGLSVGVEALANGWYRSRLSLTPSSDTTVYPSIYPSNALWDGASDPRQNLSGDSTDEVLIWGAQLEDNATSPTSVIPTSGAPATRQADTAEIDVPADSDGFAYVTYGDGGETTFAVTPGGTWTIPADLDDTYARIIFKR